MCKGYVQMGRVPDIKSVDPVGRRAERERAGQDHRRKGGMYGQGCGVFLVTASLIALALAGSVAHVL